VVGCPQGVNDVQLATSLLAQNKGFDETSVGSSGASRAGFGTLPIFESPRSSLSVESPVSRKAYLYALTANGSGTKTVTLAEMLDGYTERRQETVIAGQLDAIHADQFRILPAVLGPLDTRRRRSLQRTTVRCRRIVRALRVSPGNSTGRL
jgi:hypothetical protein